MALHEITTIPTQVGELEIYQGYETWVVEQLVTKSRTPRLMHPDAVPRDATERFASAESFDAWVNGGGGRCTYVALDRNRPRSDGHPELAQLVWLAPRAYPADTYPLLPGVEARHTYAVRAYGLERGAEHNITELENFYEGKGGSRRLSAIATAHYAARHMVEEVVEFAQADLQPGVHLETGEHNPARTGMYPHMFGPGRGYIETGTHRDERSGRVRVGMVLPYDVIATSAIARTA